MRVYLLNRGTHENRNTEGVYSTRELAEAADKTLRDARDPAFAALMDPAEIDEFELDAPAKDPVLEIQTEKIQPAPEPTTDN